jgi:SAM-dependent methyltransferase
VDEETVRVRGIYDRHASRYDRLIAVAERLLLADGRTWAASQACGSVLEVAVGTGRNLPHYPPGSAVTAVDVSEGMLARARQSVAAAQLGVDLRVGDAQRLPVADGSVDTVVATLALCSIPDDEAAVDEMARVLRPGGRLILLEHVASPLRPVRAVQRLLDPLLARLEGDHLLRRPEVAVNAAGLVVDVLERSRLGIILRLVAHKHLPYYQAGSRVGSASTSSTRRRSFVYVVAPTIRAATRPSRSTTRVLGIALGGRLERNARSTAPESAVVMLG